MQAFFENANLIKFISFAIIKCRSVFNESLCHLYVICDVTCQNQALVTVMSY